MSKTLKKENKVSLLVFVKKKYRYTDQESKLQILADKLKGKFVGGGTDLITGERDQQFIFNSKRDAKTFLSYSTVKESILKKYDLVEMDENGLVLTNE